jgi:hypothetical protein
MRHSHAHALLVLEELDHYSTINVNKLCYYVRLLLIYIETGETKCKSLYSEVDVWCPACWMQSFRPHACHSSVERVCYGI